MWLKATGSFPKAMKLKMMLLLLKISKRYREPSKNGIWGLLERKRVAFMITYPFLLEEETTVFKGF